jgi:hypothetical protein
MAIILFSIERSKAAPGLLESKHGVLKSEAVEGLWAEAEHDAREALGSDTRGARKGHSRR